MNSSKIEDVLKSVFDELDSFVKHVVFEKLRLHELHDLIENVDVKVVGEELERYRLSVKISVQLKTKINADMFLRKILNHLNRLFTTNSCRIEYYSDKSIVITCEIDKQKYYLTFYVWKENELEINIGREN